MKWLDVRQLKASTWAWIAGGMILGLIAFLPARLFEQQVNEGLAPPWHLSLSGTVWHGAGVLQAGATDASAVPFTWRFNPSPLLGLRLGWDMSANSSALTGTALMGAGWNSMELRKTALTMDAGFLQQAIPPFAIVAPTGNVVLTTPDDSHLVIDYGEPPRLNGVALLKVENFGMRPLGPMPIGTHEVKLTARDTAIDYAFTQSGGALNFEGSGSMLVARPHQLSYAGFVTASPALPENILTQLKSMGPAGADGRIRIDWKAAW